MNKYGRPLLGCTSAEARSLRKNYGPGGLRVVFAWPGFHQGRQKHHSQPFQPLAETVSKFVAEAVESAPTENRREEGHYLTAPPRSLRRCTKAR